MTTAKLCDHQLYPRGGKCDVRYHTQLDLLWLAVKIKSKTDDVCLNLLLVGCLTYIHIIKYGSTYQQGLSRKTMAFQKTRPEKTTLKQYQLSLKTVRKCIGTTLQKLKIDSKSLKTRLEWSYRISKISKTTTFSSAGLP